MHREQANLADPGAQVEAAAVDSRGTTMRTEETAKPERSPRTDRGGSRSAPPARGCACSFLITQSHSGLRTKTMQHFRRDPRRSPTPTEKLRTCTQHPLRPPAALATIPFISRRVRLCAAANGLSSALVRTDHGPPHTPGSRNQRI